MKSEVNFKIGWKQWAVMLLAILICLLIFFWVGGYFQVNSTLSDVCSFSSAKLVAESEHWELFEPEKKTREPYLTYKGKLAPSPQSTTKIRITDKDGNITYTDEVHYSSGIRIMGDLSSISDGSDERHVDQVEQGLYPDRHFFVGQQRWYLQEYGFKHIVGGSLEVKWRDYGEECSEQLSLI